MDERQLNLFDHSPEPTRKQQKLEMTRDQFIQWKRQIASHQQATRENHPQQPTLFDTGVNQFDPQGIDPFGLRQYATRFYDLAEMRLGQEGDPCLYFLIDNCFPLILYIGETVHSNQRWKGGHHVEEYLAKYIQLNRKHGLEVLPALAFEWGAPHETRLRQKMEFELIKKWRSPFNKENRVQWGHPFGE
ncbi:GIY-YIG nuclease family protein [Laspinema sp. A4]|uniref:GIY-YIG nuclease family protein n=1 Tax=Laspinema sp. D2d TaxID=2953686 RepID=UPI0021BA46D0|nr:GIY-YIG nuclease family protein [Laspinema sp. D2d]MCT7984907.1 GIY-YIG nuclease family protein [Laspinema sp. D2d]